MLHGGGLGQSWALEPGLVIPLAAAGVLYAKGFAALWRRARTRDEHRWRGASFAVGWIVLALSLLSPLHDLSEQLFSAHMVQHELLMVVAAPLLVLGRPVAVFLWALPRSARFAVARVARNTTLRRTWHTVARPFDAWLIHGVVIWVWHLPSLFQATLTSESVHALQHASFVGSALLFWWSILHGQRAARGMTIVYLFTTAVHTGVLGALMAFARVPWYPTYTNGAAIWGLSPMADQQLAGLIMWIPASVAYLLAALVAIRRWLRDSEWAVAQHEQAATSRSYIRGRLS